MVRTIGWTLLVLTMLAAGRGQGARAEPPPEDQVRIEIVWPHFDAPVAQADRANLLLYMVRSQGERLMSICNAEPPRILVATNSEPARYLKTGKAVRVGKTAKDGTAFPAWEYRDVDVSAARDPQSRLFFTAHREYTEATSAKVFVKRARTNVWAHAQDPRTHFPVQDAPLGIDSAEENVPDPQTRDVVDAKIEIVWPHGGVHVGEADRVNVSAMLFRRGTLYSVPPEFDTTVSLLAALNQDAFESVATGVKRLVTVHGFAYPVWDFDNVGVAAAKDPVNRFFFALDIASYQGYNADGSTFSQTPVSQFFSNIWVHGADSRTYFPVPDVVDTGCPPMMPTPTVLPRVSPVPTP